MLRQGLFFLILLIGAARGSILLWGSQSIQVPSLKWFDNEDFDLLRAYLRNPKIVAFRGEPTGVSRELQDLLKNKYTAYIPSSDLDIEEAMDLSGTPQENFITIRNKLDETNGENVLALIISAASPRRKRDLEETTVSTPMEPDTDYEPPTGPVLYMEQDKKKMIVYSSKPPILKINSSTIVLGKATAVTSDNRDKIKMMSVTIPVYGGKLIIKFRYALDGGYWTLNTLDLWDFESKKYTLTSNAMTAPNAFSYHCSGETVFSDVDNEIGLKLFDFQAQPDCTDGRFDDAYDCVNFMTGPIWSGLFVTFILLVVLGIGLGALNSIRTMDKFDNHKTKQLPISMSE